MKCQNEEVEVKSLPDTMMEDEETIFKKPKVPRVSIYTPPSLITIAPLVLQLVLFGGSALEKAN